MILKTMHAKTVTFVLLFLLVFPYFFAYIFFSHTLFCRVARWSPQKILRVGNGFYIGPSPDMHSPRKKSRNHSHRPGSRPGHGGVRERLGEKLAKGGQGPFTIGGAICWDGEQRRCESLHASMGQNGRPPGNEGCDSCLSQGARGGLTVLWFVPTVGGTVLPPRSISHLLPSPGPQVGTVPDPTNSG